MTREALLSKASVPDGGYGEGMYHTAPVLSIKVAGIVARDAMPNEVEHDNEVHRLPTECNVILTVGKNLNARTIAAAARSRPARPGPPHS
jgi:hypothetical protein